MDQELLGALLPALSSWRRGQQEQSRVDQWLYRVSWKPLDGAAGESLTGRWLVGVPAGTAEDAWVVSVVQGLASRGAEPVLLECAPDTDRAALAEQVGAVGEVAGALLLLGAEQSTGPDSSAAAAGLLGLSALFVQAVGTAGVGGRLWVVTRGAVSVGRSDRRGGCGGGDGVGFGSGGCVGVAGAVGWVWSTCRRSWTVVRVLGSWGC